MLLFVQGSVSLVLMVLICLAVAACALVLSERRQWQHMVASNQVADGCFDCRADASCLPCMLVGPCTPEAREVPQAARVDGVHPGKDVLVIGPHLIVAQLRGRRQRTARRCVCCQEKGRPCQPCDHQHLRMTSHMRHESHAEGS